MSLPKRERTFRELYCSRFDCRPERFERAVVLRCLHRRCLPVATLCYRLSPKFFEAELATLRYMGDALTMREIMVEMDAYSFAMRSRGHWFKRVLRVRISGRRIKRLARAVGVKPSLESKSE
jgi:hypothetical protein